MHPRPLIREGPIPHISRPAMWWWVCNKLQCNPCLPKKRKLATHRHQIPYTRPILHIIWRTYLSTPGHETHRRPPIPNISHKRGQGLLRPPHDYQIRFGTILTLRGVDYSTLNLGYSHITRLLFILSGPHYRIGEKILPNSILRYKGHLLQEQNNLWYTKQIITPSVIPSVLIAPNPIPEDVGAQANMVFIKILTISGKISSNQTGRFPVTSSRVGRYIMVMADYNSDDILAKPLTPRANTELLCAVAKMYEHLK